MDDRASALAELARLIDGVPVAMVTTRGDDDHLTSRPMLLERLEPDGSLTFLTHLSSDKVHQIARDPHVNIAFVSAKGDRYVSVSGTAAATHDPARMKTLWNMTYRAWFPDGPEDPDSAIFTVGIDRIESWDVPTSRLVRAWCAVKALATGQVVEAGAHHRRDLR